MKLRSITLTNLRRFAGVSARLARIGDGITVLSEPNEFGKSTFFDGLHALFFERHTSNAQTVKRLRPHAGGAPQVTAEIETEGRGYRIEKRWLSRPSAVVRGQDDRIVAQGDEAEAWIDGLVAGGLGGPAGLFWVRQGVLGLEHGSAKERAAQTEARRGLLSSVAGEIDLMTGGRRMDAVMARLAEELNVLATPSSGRPKRDGPWDQAIRDAAGLAERIADLEPKLEKLSSALRDRTAKQRKLDALSDPIESDKRRAALAQATANHAAGRAHAERIDRLNQAHRLAQAQAEACQSKVAILHETTRRLETATAQVAEAKAAIGAIETDLSAAAMAEKNCADALSAAEGALKEASARQTRSRNAQQELENRRRRAELTQALEKARACRAERETARARAEALVIEPENVRHAEETSRRLETLLSRQRLNSVQLRFDYSGSERAKIDDIPVDGDLALENPTRIELPGLGHVQIDPGARGTDIATEIESARLVLAAALKRCGGADSLATARAMLDERTEAAETARRAGAMLEAVAPDGIEALLARVAGLGDARDDPGLVEEAGQDPEALDAALRRAEAEEGAARGRLEAARMHHGVLRERMAAAVARLSSATDAAAEANAAMGDPDDYARAMEAARSEAVAAEAERDRAQEQCRRTSLAAPDMATLDATLQRAQSAVDQANSQTATLVRDLAELDGMIRASADAGIEETLEELRGRQVAAAERADRYRIEVAALQRLQRALEVARSAARDAYFGPVIEEMRPLLAILHGDASIEIDDASLLPEALTRDGVSEDLGILSGGTREQIAILTRLSFARLYARQGHSVPIILDDALVHSDDDRIEAMFTALHRVARDQQILVFTCRQRAFAGLGGQGATVTIEDAGGRR